MAGFDWAKKHIIEELKTDPMKQQAKFYLDMEFKNDQIKLKEGTVLKRLDFACYQLPNTLQNIVSDYQDSCEYHLKLPLPEYLPIGVLQIHETNSTKHISPSEVLDISSLVSEDVCYKLAAVVCELNETEFVYLRQFEEDQWYYYQPSFSCKKVSESSNQLINDIINSSFVNSEMIQLLHFTISPLFYNAKTYIYKKV